MRKLSVIICCYNEQATIADVIKRTQSVELGPRVDRAKSWLLIIFPPTARVKFYSKLMIRRSAPFFTSAIWAKGCPFAPASLNMTGDYMIIQDADSEYDPAEHIKFCRQG